jgi:hypothetical protein
MPTRQQMDSVIERIETLIETEFHGHSSFHSYDDGRKVPADWNYWPMSASRSEIVAAIGEGYESKSWREMGEEDRRDVLAEYVDWQGFTEAQKADVIRRVLDGEEAGFWMDGIAADAASPQRSSSYEATLMDYQPTGRNRHIERVTSRIEELKDAQYWCSEQGTPSPHTDDKDRDGYWRGVTSDGSGWDNRNNLTVVEKKEVLRHHVDWEGFARSHIKDVIDKVIRDEPAQRWMDSVRYPASPPADVQAEPPPPTPSPWPGATEEERIDAWERFRDVDGSGLTAAGRDLYYHELGGGGSTTYQLWTPDGERGDFPAGYSVVMTFQAADSENAADMAKETFFDLASGAVLTDESGAAYRFDGDTFHEFKPEPTPPPAMNARQALADKPLNVASDVYTALMTHLESAADEFARLASTPEQAAFAESFNAFVADDAQNSLKYLTGLAVAANRPDAMAELPSPTEQAEVEAHRSELIADFRSRIEGLKRDGIPSNAHEGTPWPLAVEERKLEEIIRESLEGKIRGDHVIFVPGVVALKMIERNIDYGKLYGILRDELEMLRVDAEGGHKERTGDHDPVREDLRRIYDLSYEGIGLSHEGDNYRVWQAKDPSAAAAGWSAFPEDYRPAIDVHARSLAVAYDDTNAGNWWEGDNVEVIADGVRSTRLGDVIVDPHGTAHRLAADGFKEIDPVQERAAKDEPPLDRVERQLRDWKHAHSTAFVPDPATGRIGPGTHRWLDDAWAVMPEADKLRVLESELDWTGVGDHDKAAVLAREVDPSKSPEAKPPPSLTAALLDNPKSFLPDSGPGTDHDHGPDRGR